MKNTKLRCVMLMTCAAAALILTGCRSMSGRNMFSLRGEPSAEALAGSGPTTTYPAPPSESATPEAIASIAGGTASPGTAQVAGFEVSPGNATPVANMAAAQSNGVYNGTTSADVDSTVATNTKPSGYTFGSKAFTPKPSATSPYATASTYTPPASSFAIPSTSFTPPPASSYTTPPSTSIAGGFTLPTDSPAVAAITPPVTSTASSTVPPPPTEIAPSAAAAPSFSTASTVPAVTAPAVTAPAVTAPAVTSTSDASSKSGGYTPGSTSSVPEYPTGDATPRTTGSFYR